MEAASHPPISIRHSNLRKSFKLATRSLLTACSKEAHQLLPGSSPNHTYWRGPSLISFVTARPDYNAPGSKARLDYNASRLQDLRGNDCNNLGSGGSLNFLSS
ncbi:hypothetical protein ACLOJK_033206 [Asimina triloba]